VKRLGVLCIMVSPLTATGDPVSDAKQAYMGRVDAHINSVRQHFAHATDRSATVERAVRQADRVLLRAQASARAQPLDDDNAAAVAQTASLAIKTEVDDTEAGIAFAPLVLFGMNRSAARAWNVTIAALDEDQFRIGTSYRLALDEIGPGPDDIGIPACSIEIAKYTEKIAAVADHFAAVCSVVAGFAVGAAGAPWRGDWVRALAVCGQPSPAGLTAAESAAFTAVRSGSNLLASLSTINLFTSSADKVAPPALAAQLDQIRSSLKRLDTIRTSVPSRTSCLKQDDIDTAAIRAKWAVRDRAAGLSIHGDFFPIQGGFDADRSKTDPSGELAEVEARAEFRYSWPRWSWTAGVGAKWSRDAPDDELALAVSPSAAVEFVVARLDGKEVLDEDRAVRLTKDGELPPFMVLGLDTGADILTSPPETQESALDKFNLTLFADFRIAEKLAFRVGVPLEGEATKREADGKRGVVWTVPVFLTTVLKI
jgi:hypothetical protein